MVHTTDAKKEDYLVIKDNRLDEIKLSLEQHAKLAEYVSKAEIKLQRGLENLLEQQRDGPLSLAQSMQIIQESGASPDAVAQGLILYVSDRANGVQSTVSPPSSIWNRIQNLFTDHRSAAIGFETEARYQIALQACAGKSFGIDRGMVKYYVDHLFSDDSNIDYMHLWLANKTPGYEQFFITNLGLSLTKKLQAVESDIDRIYLAAMHEFKKNEPTKESWERSLARASTPKQRAFLNERMEEWEGILRTYFSDLINIKYAPVIDSLKKSFGIELKPESMDGVKSQLALYFRAQKGDVLLNPAHNDALKGYQVRLKKNERCYENASTILAGEDLIINNTAHGDQGTYKSNEFEIVFKGGFEPTFVKVFGSIEKGASTIIETEMVKYGLDKNISLHHPHPEDELAFMTNYRKLLFERFEDLEKRCSL